MQRNYSTSEQITAEEKMDLFTKVDEITFEFVQWMKAFSEEEMNRIASEGSWTAAQVADHVRKSNNGIAQAFQMPGTDGERPIDARVNELKTVFMDFTRKLQSPKFILPEETDYNKTELIEKLKESINKIREAREHASLGEIIHLSALGTISKLELLHFVIVHTKRHINQLKNIFQKIKSETNDTD
jgi:DinB family protein